MNWDDSYRCGCGNSRKFLEVLWEQDEGGGGRGNRWAWIVATWCRLCGEVLYEAPEVALLRLMGSQDDDPLIATDRLYLEQFGRLPADPFAYLPEDPIPFVLSWRPSETSLRVVEHQVSRLRLWLWQLAARLTGRQTPRSARVLHHADSTVPAESREETPVGLP
jgi:hypothetical protein